MNLHEIVFRLCLIDVDKEGRPQVLPKLRVEETLPKENVALLVINHDWRCDLEMSHQREKHLKLLHLFSS